ncbi:MAG TPA: NAD(P)/FAD-dependent oxidoreductase [Terriglobia bacterium]|nr:NAD(P)/FAD-dependent oxidoreductase [Terriglobia bacterium]
MKTIAIVGGGPAGAMTGEKLARGFAANHNGQGPTRVVVFEEKFGWEKPCGGGLSHKALRRYPFLLESEGFGKPVQNMEVWAPGGAVLRLRLREPLAIYTRRELNHFLLQRSEKAGTEVIKDRIVGFTRVGERWELKGREERYQADHLVLAAGARSRLRKHLVDDLKPRDFMLTFGYYVPGNEDLLRIEFFEDFEGYAWSFPRLGHLSVGICGKVGQTTMAELQQNLGAFMNRCGYSSTSAPVFSHLLPSLVADSWGDLRLAGPGWALVGDVGGLADPVTGEGIYFALRSGELLAEALLSGFPDRYPQQVWDEFGSMLMLGARMCPSFYRGDFLGDAVTTRTIQFAARSKTFRSLFQSLVEGTQTYHGLPARFLCSLPKSLIEATARTLLERVGF